MTVLTVADPAGLAAVELVALGTTGRLVTAPDVLDQATDILVRDLEDIDRVASRFRDDSDLSRVNRAAGRPVTVSALFVTAVEVALRAARLTGGDVDPTVGHAMGLVGYDRDFAAVAPDGPPLRLVARPVPGWRTVAVDPTAGTVRVPAGVALDLGATAKALAADRIATRVEAVTGAGVLVALGGDVAVAGTPPVGGWAIRVTDDHRASRCHPAWDPHCAPVDWPGQTVAIHAGGLATSSTAVRSWAAGGPPPSSHARPDHWATGGGTVAHGERVWRIVCGCQHGQYGGHRTGRVGRRVVGVHGPSGSPGRPPGAGGQRR